MKKDAMINKSCKTACFSLPGRLLPAFIGNFAREYTTQTMTMQMINTPIMGT